MNADDFAKYLNADQTPAGRLDLVQQGVEAGLINKYQALKLLDIDTSEVDAMTAKLGRSMRVAAATNPLLGGRWRIVT